MARVRSLEKNGEDQNQFRHHRNRLVGHSVSSEFFQPCPFLYTRENAQVNLIGNYRGSSAFLICNGPSLVNGDYDLNALKQPGVMTMGINNGPKTIRPNFWTCVDDPKRFLLSIWLDPTIQKIVPHAHAEKRLFDSNTWQDQNTLVGQCPNVIYYHRNSKFKADRWLYEDTINWGNSKDHGGSRSVMLPALRLLFLMGFRRVYLLGVDLNMSEQYTYHFDEQRDRGAVKGNMSTYNKMENEYFPQLRPYFDEAGFEVYNCNPNSGLTAFDYMPYEEAIAECTSRLGEVSNERTWGMYTKAKEKVKWKNEPDETRKAHMAYLQNAPQNTVYDIRTPSAAPERVAPPQPIIPPQPQPIVEQRVVKSPPVPRAGTYKQTQVAPAQPPQIAIQPQQEVRPVINPVGEVNGPIPNPPRPPRTFIPPIAERPQPRNQPTQPEDPEGLVREATVDEIKIAEIEREKEEAERAKQVPRAPMSPPIVPPMAPLNNKVPIDIPSPRKAEDGRILSNVPFGMSVGSSRKNDGYTTIEDDDK